MKTTRQHIGSMVVTLAGAAVLALVLGLMMAMPDVMPVLAREAWSALPPETVEESAVLAPAVLLAPVVSLAPQAEITVPFGTTPKTDGFCGDYTDGARYEFNDVGGMTGTVYLKQDREYLYVCMEGALGQNPDRFARVYLDVDHGREAFAEQDDLALQVMITSANMSSYHGTGVPDGYEPADFAGWGAQTSADVVEIAEYAIPLNLTGGWCGADFGLAVYHHAVNVDDDYGWPSNQFYDQPETWMSVALEVPPCGGGNIAYVYRRDIATAGDFKTMLESEGFAVNLIPLSAVTATAFSRYDLTIIADDTGYLSNWGSGVGQVTSIISAAQPILGLGEGGYAFFGQLSSPIGWPHGWHGQLDQVYAADSSLSHYQMPYNLGTRLPGPFAIYQQPVGEVGIYLREAVSPSLAPVGLEPPYPTGELADHAPVIADLVNLEASACRQLWGYDGGPTAMNADGRRLFVNTVVQGLNSFCPSYVPPDPCIAMAKTASPPEGTPVQPGDTIRYTVNYTVSPNCPVDVARATLLDPLPADTLFVPGSASDGVTPNADDTLVWSLGILSPGDTGSKAFAVYVLDTQCNNQRRVNNTASLKSSQGTAESNLVSHPVKCPPIGFPNDEPPYAESEIQIHPYPLVTGRPSQVSVKVSNYSSVTQMLTVAFQVSPQRFGIGLNYGAFDTQVVAVPANSNVIVYSTFIPVSSGHYCMQIKVQAPGYEPVVTQRNLDVTEDLEPGVEDVLTFTVGNPTSAVADILLMVDNTCPGWTAWVTPTTLTGVGPNGSDLRQATLHVIPPLANPLGTACHIDVQGWIGGDRSRGLIGGIRKLDVPPVHLPDAEPVWEEREISLSTYPPTVGQPISYCVEIQNPLAYTRTVTLRYEVADFGAGIYFTSIATRTVDLPPNSIDTYCVTWTPAAGGTLHRCLRIALMQAGYPTEYSQRNVQLERFDPVVGPIDIAVPFVIGNPYPFTQTPEVDVTLLGLHGLQTQITPDLPAELGPDEVRPFTLTLAPLAGAEPLNYGDASRVEVALYLDGMFEGGFTVEYAPEMDGGQIAYVYRGDLPAAYSFENLLTSRGYSMTLVPLSSVRATDFTPFDLIIIADDTGHLSTWGTAAGQVAHIAGSDTPIIGLGEGGYAFFGQLSLFIGWPHGWHGPEWRVDRAPGAPSSIYNWPNAIPPDPVVVYAEPVNEVGIYLGGADTLPVDAQPIGLEPNAYDHASLILQGCRQLWGFSGHARKMTATGQDLFVNVVEYMLAVQCPVEEPPPEQCLEIRKEADPPSGAPVEPGDMITYTLVYTMSDHPECESVRGQLRDVIPPDTLYIPNSASGGVMPQADGSLVWPVQPGEVGATQSFAVRVSDTQCNNERRVIDQATLTAPNSPPVKSNIVEHPVDCPPIGFPNDEPPYAESEIQIHPYPLVTGQPSQISVKVSNYSSVTQVLTVAFQTSPSRFGIGLDYNSFDTRVVTVPASSNVIVHSSFTPVSSGHYCIQIRVQGAGFPPIFTQRNLDVTENLEPGVTDTLSFKVRNNTATTDDITMVAINTCPGWTAVVSPSVLTGVAPGEVRDVDLLVTPPDPVVLGTACHIDVQAWINGDRSRGLIGGIRKLDVPPVHLPDAEPVWEEREISLSTYPPVVGQPISYCVEIQNPLGFTRTITLVYEVADFGAGVYFTPIATRTIDLPPNSIDTYCVTWTPTAGGTLHRCLRVTLKQSGYPAEHSQRNVQLERFNPVVGPIGDVPIVIGNPYPFTQTPKVDVTLFGLHGLQASITPSLPLALGPDEVRPFTLTLEPLAGAEPLNYGDASRVEVALYLNDRLEGGFTVEYEPGEGPGRQIAYVYRGDATAANSFDNLLTSRGYTVTLIPLASVLTTDFAQFDLILIADDTGHLSNWGTAAGQVMHIAGSDTPIMGLGEGGYAFFGQLSLLIGWPHGWHGPEWRVDRAPGAPSAIYNSPSVIPPDPVDVYAEPVNEVGIYLGDPDMLPADVIPIGLEPNAPDHASLILQGCRQLWGFSGHARAMTATGQDLFINDVEYMRMVQCPVDDPPPEQCLEIRKEADPPAGTPVQPSDTITYTLVYTMSDHPECESARGRLSDGIPDDTIYVPNSASGGATPQADGSLVWPVLPGEIGATQSFAVRVSDTQCNNERRVINQATLLMPNAPPVQSNLVEHPVDCPPIGFPNDEPPYAESEIQIHPYPLVTGQPSQISVKVSNYSSVTQILTVAFQTSANRFGIGLNYNSFDTRVVVVPAHGNVIVHSAFTPVSSGHYCIQIRVQGAGFPPIFTQRNIDVTENLEAGVTDTLTFKVRNNTATAGDITMVAINTCPGWTAVVSPSVLTGMAPGEVRDVDLLVTPPDPVVLGTACHIDVQAWINGDRSRGLIGGIRKLDVPPVHLPQDVDPPWMEPEISLIPDPPIVGQPTDYCIELQNPLSFTRTVTLVYEVADFGAGIYFTPIATRTVNLPPNSIADYCASWTPATGGTLHRCLLVTLKQSGYQDETSQRNVDVRKIRFPELNLSDVLGIIRNPDPLPHKLELRPMVYGIGPFWQLQIRDGDGNPLPNTLGPNESVEVHLGFVQTAGAQVNVAQQDSQYHFGDESRVEVEVYLDGASIGGFSAVYEAPPNAIYLPLILKN